MLVIAFPGHAGRRWPLTRWRSLARTSSDAAPVTLTAFPGHAGRRWPLTRWRSLARTSSDAAPVTLTAFPGHADAHCVPRPRHEPPAQRLATRSLARTVRWWAGDLRTADRRVRRAWPHGTADGPPAHRCRVSVDRVQPDLVGRRCVRRRDGCGSSGLATRAGRALLGGRHDAVRRLRDARLARR